MVARGSGGAGMRSYCLKSTEFQLCKMKRATETGGGDGCTICCRFLVAKLCPTLVTPWTVARQVPLSVGFPRQEYWSKFPFPSLADLPDPGFKPLFPSHLLLAGNFFLYC